MFLEFFLYYSLLAIIHLNLFDMYIYGCSGCHFLRQQLVHLQTNTIDLENFRVINFRVLNFRVKYFCGPGYPRKFFAGSTFPGLVIWNETTHAKSMHSLHAAFVATMQLLANY